MNPPVVRAPNGVMQDSSEFFGAGKPYYDPAKITMPTLLVGAEWVAMRTFIWRRRYSRYW